jgi:hypothetical protein
MAMAPAVQPCPPSLEWMAAIARAGGRWQDGCCRGGGGRGAGRDGGPDQAAAQGEAEAGHEGPRGEPGSRRVRSCMGAARAGCGLCRLRGGPPRQATPLHSEPAPGRAAWPARDPRLVRARACLPRARRAKRRPDRDPGNSGGCRMRRLAIACARTRLGWEATHSRKAVCLPSRTADARPTAACRYDSKAAKAAQLLRDSVLAERGLGHRMADLDSAAQVNLTTFCGYSSIPLPPARLLFESLRLFPQSLSLP